MSKEKQIEEMTCEKCLHYEMCLEKFRNAKKDGFCEFVDEEEYFSHADECDFFVTGYRKQSEGEWVEKNIFFAIYKCSICGAENLYKDGHACLSKFCPNCGARMGSGE